MAPKKPLTPQQAAESTDDAQLIIQLSSCSLQLALQVEDSSEPQPILAGPSAPTLEILAHDAPVQDGDAPSWAPITIDAEKNRYPVELQKTFRYPVKGAVLLEKLLSTSIVVTLRAADSKELVATATIDTAPFCLGEWQVVDSLDWQPAAGSPYKLIVGSTVEMQARLMGHEMEGGELQLRPLKLLPPAEAAEANILELVSITAAPVPPGLPAAANVAGGALTCALGLSLAGDSCMVMGSSGQVKEAAAAWGNAPRTFLGPAAVQQLKEALESGQAMQAEVARYLGAGAEHLADPAFPCYHALLAVAAEELAEPGRREVTLRAVPVCTAAQATATGQLAASKLPAYVPPPGSRARTVEDAPEDPEALCAWQAAGTRFTIALRLARPLYPPWVPPPAPSKTLRELLPAREAPPPPPTKTPLQQFQEEVRGLAQQLVAECKGQLSSNSRPASGADSGGSAALTPAQQQQQLVYHLNKSGRYLAAKEQLKAAVLKVVEASRTEDNDEAALARLSTQLYSQLMVEVRSALEGLSGQQQQQAAAPAEQAQEASVAASPEAPTPERVLEMAEECEGAGDMARCHRLHQQRVLACSSSPQSLTDYACFCLRVGDRARAEACLREALADNSGSPQHLPAVRLLVLLLLEAAQPGAPAPAAAAAAPALEQAEVLAHSLKEAEPGSALAWSLLKMTYRLQGQMVAARSCAQEVVRLAKVASTEAAAAVAATAAAAAAAAAASVDGSSGAGDVPPSVAASPRNPPVGKELPAAANGYLAAAKLALEVKLAGVAKLSLMLAAGVPDAAGGWRRALLAAQAQLAALNKDTTGAGSLLKQLQGLLEAAGEPTTLLHIMQGDMAFEAGQMLQAKQHYRRALAKGGAAACPRSMLLRMARTFADTGDASPALDTYLGIAAAYPRCCTAWLGAGAAYLRLQEFQSADLALCEASQLDPEHPEVWGQLALAAWLQGNTAEAEQATATAMRLGLSTGPLLLQLADQAQAAGSFQRAAALLAAASAAGADSVAVRCKRAAVALAESRYEEANTQLAAAALMPANPQEADMLQGICEKLKVQWPHL